MEEYREIDLLELFSLLWQRVWLIILTALIFGAAAFSYAVFVMTPRYKATALMYVNNSTLSIGSTDVSMSGDQLSVAKSLVDTYIVILKTRTTLEEVIEATGVSYTYEELYDMIEASDVNSTEVFGVSVTSADAREAAYIANTITQILPKKIAGVMDGSSARLVDYAVVPAVKTSPDVTKLTAIGAVLGIVISCAAVLLAHYFDEKIHDESHLLDNYDEPLLAAIPDLARNNGGDYKNQSAREGYDRAGKKNRNDQYIDGGKKAMIGPGLSFAGAEAYKLLRTNLLFSLPENEDSCRMLGITSALRGEGKTTTSINLAYSLAEAGKKVLLLEADMRLPNIAKRLELRRTPGLSNLLAGISKETGTIQRSEMMDNLHIMVAGDMPPNPSELLGTQRMKALVTALSKLYDFIIFDLPPITAVSDSLVLSQLLGGVIMVVRKNYCERRVLADAMRQIGILKIKVLGFTMTCADSTDRGYKSYRDYSVTGEGSGKTAHRSPGK